MASYLNGEIVHFQGTLEQINEWIDKLGGSGGGFKRVQEVVSFERHALRDEFQIYLRVV